MKWQREKNLPADYLGDGVKIELETVDDSVKAVTLFAGDKIVRFKKPDNYSDNLDVLVPAKPKMVERFRLHGQIGAAEIDQLFEGKADADAAYEDLGEPANVKVERVKVPEDNAPVVLDETPF